MTGELAESGYDPRELFAVGRRTKLECKAALGEALARGTEPADADTEAIDAFAELVAQRVAEKLGGS